MAVPLSIPFCISSIEIAQQDYTRYSEALQGVSIEKDSFEDAFREAIRGMQFVFKDIVTNYDKVSPQLNASNCIALRERMVSYNDLLNRYSINAATDASTPNEQRTLILDLLCN